MKLTNLVIRDAIVQGASDIHIEPGRKVGAIRFRVDGVLRKHMDLPKSAMNRVISRVKILSKLDIADRLRPQDGKARVRIHNLAYDLRVSTIPAGVAEKCVIRVLDSNAAQTLEDLTLPTYELDRMRQLLSLREGIILVTGPTGSGKTTTLYGALRELADGEGQHHDRRGSRRVRASSNHADPGGDETGRDVQSCPAGDSPAGPRHHPGG